VARHYNGPTIEAADQGMDGILGSSSLAGTYEMMACSAGLQFIPDSM